MRLDESRAGEEGGIITRNRNLILISIEMVFETMKTDEITLAEPWGHPKF